MKQSLKWLIKISENAIFKWLHSVSRINESVTWCIRSLFADFPDRLLCPYVAAKHSYTFNWITTHSLQIIVNILCTTIHSIIHIQRVNLRKERKKNTRRKKRKRNETQNVTPTNGQTNKDTEPQEQTIKPTKKSWPKEREEKSWCGVAFFVILVHS